MLAHLRRRHFVLSPEHLSLELAFHVYLNHPLKVDLVDGARVGVVEGSLAPAAVVAPPVHVHFNHSAAPLLAAAAAPTAVATVAAPVVAVVLLLFSVRLVEVFELRAQNVRILNPTPVRAISVPVLLFVRLESSSGLFPVPHHLHPDSLSVLQHLQVARQLFVPFHQLQVQIVVPRNPVALLCTHGRHRLKRVYVLTTAVAWAVHFVVVHDHALFEEELGPKPPHPQVFVPIRDHVIEQQHRHRVLSAPLVRLHQHPFLHQVPPRRREVHAPLLTQFEHPPLHGLLSHQCVAPLRHHLDPLHRFKQVSVPPTKLFDFFGEVVSA
mmetsp:Transcript_49958/g.100592  ORF Transcript_49958/g.100592 Transcript_49958/m.100592 type:complete len:324 (+) Transcript_49958:540-1511(+)